MGGRAVEAEVLSAEVLHLMAPALHLSILVLLVVTYIN